ncbi:4485_t:CDS:1, partial [Cetraspora pellucida]
ASFLQTYPNLLNCIYDSIEFRVAENKRRRKIIKVRTVNYLVNDIRNIYSEYIVRSTINNYLQPSCSNSIAAKTHHYSANIMVSSVSRTDNNVHPDKHYCLAFVKVASQYAFLFSKFPVIISQNNKAKVSFSIIVVGRTFRVLQTIREPVTVSEHDFLIDA